MDKSDINTAIRQGVAEAFDEIRDEFYEEIVKALRDTADEFEKEIGGMSE